MFDAVISLGHRCYTAQHIRRMMIHGGTMPLDWIISSSAGVADALVSDFEGMFDPQSLELFEGHVLDRRYGFQHVHDFPLKPDFIAHRDKAVARYALLTRRIRTALNSKRRLLFIRHEEPGIGGLDTASRIVEAMARLRAPSSFHLLFLTELESDRAVTFPDNVSHVRIAPDAGEDAAAWDCILEDFHARHPIKGYYPRLVKGMAGMPPAVAFRAQKVLGISRRSVMALRHPFG